jgi:hypothetical protein
MTTLQEATTATTPTTRLVERVARGLSRFSRRGFLVQTAVVGSALAVDPKGYVLTPQTAASTVCGPSASCSAGYTVMCCTINKGVNGCPPGTFAAGWWKAADSSWCGGGYRYIVDCNASCSDCTSGCSGDNICSKGCWSCGCKCGSSATCDQRRVCCNAFRYGQCNTHIRCSGGVACRVVSCVAPYKWANCTTTSLTDNATAEHSAPCLPRWSPIMAKYDAMNSLGSALGTSVGPERAVGDGRGRYVDFQHGTISWSSTTRAHAVTGYPFTRYRALGRERGALGYPTTDRAYDGSSWVQYFEKGALADTTSSSTAFVYGAFYVVWKRHGTAKGALGYPLGDPLRRADAHTIQYFQRGVIADTGQSWSSALFGVPYSRWRDLGGEKSVLGYPVSEVERWGDGWVQRFERGAMADTTSSSTTFVYGAFYVVWQRHGTAKGALGYPLGDPLRRADAHTIQYFQHGVIADTSQSWSSALTGVPYSRWRDLGGEKSVLGYPVSDAVAGPRSGGGQRFEHGQLWWAAGATPRAVRGRVLTAWEADGGAAGRWGYPLEDTVLASDGSQHQRFEGGVLTA